MELVEQWEMAWCAHDPDRFASLFTTDGVYEDLPLQIVSKGPGEIRNYMRDWLVSSPDVVMNVTNAIRSDHHAAAEWIFTGTHAGPFAGIKPTGRRFELRGASVFRFGDRAITACCDYWDLATLRRNLND